MQIPSEYLKESNYEGTRLIEVTDEAVLSLTAELSELQKEANPYLEKMEALTPQMDPIYSEIAELEAKKRELQAKVAPIREQYDAEMAFVEEIDQRATLIKSKVQPIINDLVKGELGEFERAMQTVHKDGKLYVEVQDQLEEKIKQLRANKQ